MAKILVATSTSQNKMNKVVELLQEGLAKHNITAEVVAENVFEVKIAEVNPDVIVLVGINKLDTQIPTIDGVPFMTGIGTDGVIKQLVDQIA